MRSAYIVCLNIYQQLNAYSFCRPIYSPVDKSRQVSAYQKKIGWNRAEENLRKVSRLDKERGFDVALEPLNLYKSDFNTGEYVIRFITVIISLAPKMLLNSFPLNIGESNMGKAILLVYEKLVNLQHFEIYREIPGNGQTNCDVYYNSVV